MGNPVRFHFPHIDLRDKAVRPAWMLEEMVGGNDSRDLDYAMPLPELTVLVPIPERSLQAAQAVRTV